MRLTEFLLARIAEDESAARAVIAYVGDHHAGDLDPDAPSDLSPEQREAWTFQMDAYPSHPWGIGEAELAFVRQWDPERVLAECEAKRRIVAAHNLTTSSTAYGDSALYWSCDCLDGVDYEREGCPTTLAMASVYADHPDYQSEWAAEARASSGPDAATG